MNPSKSNGQYEVLSPWSEVDTVPLRGITPRLTDLAGKKIGLYCNWKPMARPVLNIVEQKLKERFPSSEISWYSGGLLGLVPYGMLVTELEGNDVAKYQEWGKGVDAVVSAIAD